jgi:hypothetical protein
MPARRVRVFDAIDVISAHSPLAVRRVRVFDAIDVISAHSAMKAMALGALG